MGKIILLYLIVNSIINLISSQSIYSKILDIFSGNSNTNSNLKQTATNYSNLDELRMHYERLQIEIKELGEKINAISPLKPNQLKDLNIEKKSTLKTNPAVKKEIPTISVIKPTESNKKINVIDNNLRQTNLLFIMFDDLRPELSIYGRKHMITPNFERLASRSVVFDYAYSQVAVCNPSRDSLLTGLRPDTVGTYNFQHSFRPHLSIPTQLGRSGYNTAGIGKIFHWDGWDRDIWNYYEWENDWYKYQGRENNFMNSSAMPDKVRDEKNFRDHEFTERAVETMKKLANEPKHFMLAMGFKLPHLALHVPYKYYEMYRGKNVSQHWQLTRRELKFPASSPEVAYRCCAENTFRFMKKEGSAKSDRVVSIGDINNAFTSEMHDELMRSYCAGVTFVDKQLGKLLDEMDRLDLWSNTTVVLTADHGMHNGEKGIWEKWTLFDESTRVPLLISHPQSPFQGQHYKDPVELVDVFATLNELLKAPYDEKKIYNKMIHILPQGKSLAPVLLGKEMWEKNFPQKKGSIQYKSLSVNNNEMPMLEHNFAISQSTRCALKSAISDVKTGIGGKSEKKANRKGVWTDCNVDFKGNNEISLIGYSMRTPEYRYTAYFHYNRTSFLGNKVEVDLLNPPYQQELYDHKNETLADFTHREIMNLAYKPSYSVTVNQLKAKLIQFIREKIVYHDLKK